VLTSRVWLARPREEVFAFFADPRNLPRITPPWLRLRLLAPPPPMAAGAVLDYRIAWLGVPLRWRAVIREWEPPAGFVDVQVRGPYARWEHRHRFVPDRGGTWVEDHVTYRLPFGALGRLVHARLVRRQLEAIWAYRRARLAALLAPALDAPP